MIPTDARRDQDVVLEAHQLCELLRTHPLDSAGRLLAFAERYAARQEEIDRAALLQMMSLRTAAGAAAREAGADTEAEAPSAAVALDDLIERMVALINGIAADYASGNGREAVQTQEIVMAQLREHLLRRAPANETVFECWGLEKCHGTDFKLGRLDLTLRLGEITGVVGQNGHGKTTLLRLVAGDLASDSGTASYPLLLQEGSRIDWRRVKEHIAMVPQELPPWRGNLEDTLRFEASLHGIRGEDNHRAVQFIIERLSLGNHLLKRWDQLSGGYKLRFALARAMVWKPRLLVMDEPLANLDVKAKGALLQDVRDLAKSYGHPIAVIMSSHDLHNLESICSQMVFLQDGQVRFVGSARDVAVGQTQNEFDIGTSASLAQVRELLADTRGLDVRQEGLNLLIRTELSMTPSTLLSLLLARGIDVQYFRDNSHSLRRLFQ